ncbi:MAG TPA: hypothetical protein VGR15_10585 [Bacteroidota bacterium]|jgi:hypothetical protein|nr:hypothetical protein [Bacteroidota bacterium]
MKSPEFNPHLKTIYLKAAATQLQANNPPETRQAFDRLRGMGYSEKDAKTLIASVIACESYVVIKSGKPYDHDRFVRNLKRLPDQEFEEE